METFKEISRSADTEANGLRRISLLFFLGFFIILLGILILVVVAVLAGDSVNFGALIFIGPFPIVIGAGPEATWMILFAVILAVLTIAMFLVLRKKQEKAKV